MIKYLVAGIVLFLSVLSVQANELVDINTANIDVIESVNGIGVVKAQAIVKYREQNGPFKSVDGLVSVKGIGEKTLAKIRSKLTVSVINNLE